jgi:hypothetical protein
VTSKVGRDNHNTDSRIYVWSGTESQPKKASVLVSLNTKGNSDFFSASVPNYKND